MHICRQEACKAPTISMLTTTEGNVNSYNVTESSNTAHTTIQSFSSEPANSLMLVIISASSGGGAVLLSFCLLVVVFLCCRVCRRKRRRRKSIHTSKC